MTTTQLFDATIPDRTHDRTTDFTGDRTAAHATDHAGPRTAVRTATDDRRAVRAALRSEWIKLTALRANAMILVLTAGIGAVIAGGLAFTATDASLTAGELFIYPLPLVAMLAAVAGILMFTGEAQHGSLSVILSARPARWVVVVAKAVTAAFVGAVLGTAGMTAGFAGAVVGGAEIGSVSHVVSRAAWALLYIVLAALIGLGVGMISRHTAAAITGLLMWSFVVESLFSPMLPQAVRHALPFSAGYRLLDAGPNFEAPVVIAHQLARFEYALIFGGYALAALAIGTLLVHRRDTN